jgi:hypothetical protein
MYKHLLTIHGETSHLYMYDLCMFIRYLVSITFDIKCEKILLPESLVSIGSIQRVWYTPQLAETYPC